MNDVIFSRHFLGLESLRVKVLDPWAWMTVFFQEARGEAPAGPPPVLLHVLGGRGERSKIDKLKRAGLWFLGEASSAS
jgi:hypothetical protein